MKRLLGSALALVVSLVVLPASAQANIIPVTSVADPAQWNGKCELREALQASLSMQNIQKPGTKTVECPAGSGTDTITFPPNALITIGNSDEPFNFSSDLTLLGPVVLNADGKSRIAEVGGAHTIKMFDVTFTRGNDLGDGGGGGLLIDSSAATVESTDGAFLNNEASDETGGSAIFTSGADVSLTGTKVWTNSASKGPGAIAGGGNISITSSNFFQNTSGAAGAAVWCTSGTLSIYESEFNSNYADGNADENGTVQPGGAVSTACATDIFGSHFGQNHARKGNPGGGAIAFRGTGGTPAVIEDSSLNENQALDGGSGGGIYAKQPFKIVRSSVTNGESASDGLGGGGIFINTPSDPDTEIANVTIANNRAGNLDTPQYGAGVYVQGSSHVRITNSALWNNQGLDELYLASVNGVGTVFLRNDILASGPLGKRNCDGDVALMIDDGNNLQTPDGASCGGGMIEAEPKLNPDTTNAGAATLYFGRPTSDSPVLKKGHDMTCQNDPILGIDERSVARPLVECAIGPVDSGQ